MIKNYFPVLLPFLLIIVSCVSSNGAVVRTGSMPSWVNDVYSAFNKDIFVAATGFGKDRAQAEANAFASLSSFFGQSVEVERAAAASYRQAIVDGVMDSWVDTAEMKTNIKTISSIDNLIGAEIKEVWYNSKDTYYAVAVLEKAEVIRIYSQLLDVNNNVIEKLVRTVEQDRHSLQSVMCLYFAETLAKVNEMYRQIIWILGGETNDVIAGPFYYRIEANRIISQNPVSIIVTDDRNGRISSEFSKAFANLGFQTVSVRSASAARTRYILEAGIVLSPVSLPGNPNIFSRIELIASFKDANLNQIIIPYSFISREGHVTQYEADNRCFTVAERNISDMFASLLSDYLRQLRPKT